VTDPYRVARAVRVSEEQAGNISHAQLLSCGFDRKAIARRVRQGWLVRVLPRVFRIGGDVDAPFADEWAALLWAGEEGGLEGASAGHVFGFARQPQRTHLVLPRNPGTHPKVVVHRPQEMPLLARTSSGLRAVQPLNALLSLAATLEPLPLERALAEAQITDDELHEAATTSRPGMPKLRTILDETKGYTRNDAERDLQRLILHAGLPQPRYNAVIAGHRADAYWPEHGLVLEFDGYGAHRTRKKFENDAIASAHYAASGLRLIRITWRQLRNKPLEVVSNIAVALSRDARGSAWRPEAA
jgi:very-short-patch-repair endonuclease